MHLLYVLSPDLCLLLKASSGKPFGNIFHCRFYVKFWILVAWVDDAQMGNTSTRKAPGFPASEVPAIAFSAEII